jgi:predicted acylesterase/phospholipase RssA
MPKVGFVFSGAGARIAQECALSEALIEGLTPSGRKIRPDVVAGTSAGALNAIAVNAVIRSKEQPQAPAFSWDDYQRILFDMDDAKIFNTTAREIAKILSRNIPEGFVLDTTPLRNLLEATLAKMKFDTLGSLYLPTYISVVEKESGRIHRLFSHNPDPAVRDFSLADVLMATSAIPVAFKPVKIKGLEGEFVDGGVGRDGIPVEAMITEKCRELYVISKMRGGNDETEAAAFRKKRPRMPKILLTGLLSTEHLMNNLFEYGLVLAPLIARQAFLYMPKLSRQYPMLDFSTQREQYEETMIWARKNDPLPLKETDLKKRMLRHLSKWLQERKK